MKRLKLYFVTACIVFGGIHMGFGQEHQSEKVEAVQKKDMFKSLNLTKDQEGKIAEVRKHYKSKMDEVNNTGGISDELKRKQLKELRMKQHYEMNNVLTEEQKQQLKESYSEYKAQKREAYSNTTTKKREEAYLNRLDSVVSLTPVQKESIQKAVDKYSKISDGIWQDETLSDEDRRLKMEQLRKDQRKQIESNLNEDQQKLLQESRSNREAKSLKRSKASPKKSEKKKEVLRK